MDVYSDHRRASMSNYQTVPQQVNAPYYSYRPVTASSHYYSSQNNPHRTHPLPEHPRSQSATDYYSYTYSQQNAELQSGYPSRYLNLQSRDTVISPRYAQSDSHYQPYTPYNEYNQSYYQNFYHPRNQYWNYSTRQGYDYYRSVPSASWKRQYSSSYPDNSHYYSSSNYYPHTAIDSQWEVADPRTTRMRSENAYYPSESCPYGTTSGGAYSNYASYAPHPSQQAMSQPAAYGQQPYGSNSTSAQHNHPPYYHTQGGGTSSAYGTGPYTTRDQMYSNAEGYAYANGGSYAPGSHISSSNVGTAMAHTQPQRYNASSAYPSQPSEYSSYPANYSAYADPTQSYHQSHQAASSGNVMSNSKQQSHQSQSNYPVPNSLSLKSSTPAAGTTTGSKNPYGQTGPYGNDSTNTQLDYYRKLYYPYDPITGEYMKDATPPDNTANSGMATGAQGTSYDQQRLQQSGGNYSSYNGVASNAMSRYGPSVGDGLVRSTGGGNMMMGNSSNYYGRMDNDDSLLLCCDFLIPRPSINCLIITLFAMLVLIIIFTVVKFTIIYPSDSTNEETIALVDQIVVLLLFAALIALIWIFGIYFTSRRTRRQIAALLSCTNPSVPITETSLVPDYDGYMNYGTSHHHHGDGRSTTTALTNQNSYRYANNYV